MAKFADLVEQIDNLSAEELIEMKRIVEKKWMQLREQEVIDSVKEARQERLEGKTLVLSSPEEIKSYFERVINGDRV